MKFLRKNLYIKFAAVTSVFLATGGVWMLSTASAATTNQLYLSPASASVQQGSTFTVDLRANPDPTKPIDTVYALVNYDATKLTLQGVDCTGSPLTAFPSC